MTVVTSIKPFENSPFPKKIPQKENHLSNYSGISFTRVRHHGNLCFKDCSTTHETLTRGYFISDTSEVGELSIGESLSFNDSECRGRVWVEGNVNAVNSEFHSIEARGSVIIRESNVTKGIYSKKLIYAAECKILGEVQACRDVNLEKVGEVGSVSAGDGLRLIRTSVNGDVSAEGRVFLKACNIKGTLSLTAQKAHAIASSNLGSIVVKGGGGEEYSFLGSLVPLRVLSFLGRKSSQSLTVTNKTRIIGTVTFEGGDGILYLDEGSVLMGRVIGGEVKKFCHSLAASGMA